MQRARWQCRHRRQRCKWEAIPGLCCKAAKPTVGKGWGTQAPLSRQEFGWLCSLPPLSAGSSKVAPSHPDTVGLPGSGVCSQHPWARAAPALGPPSPLGL